MRPQKHSRAPHGTISRYTAGCSCLQCCDAWSEYQQSVRDGRTHVPQTMPPEEARTSVIRLLEHISVAEIARRSGLNRSTIRDIRDGRYPIVRRSTFDAIRGVRVDPFVPHEFECRNCGQTVAVLRHTDHRRVYCSAACERAYWRRVTKNPTGLTVHRAWELEWYERSDAS